MTSRFPGPWRIAEFPNGFAVYDAADRQLGFFYGRADPKMAGHAGFLMIDDARQIAVDFAKLPELLKQTSGPSEVPTEDEKLAKLETNRSPQGGPETSGLLRTPRLSTVAGLPLAEALTRIRPSVSRDRDEPSSPQMLRRPSDPRSIRMKFLIPIAVVALPAGYVFFGDSDPPANVAVVPQVTADRLSAEFSPLRATVPSSKATDIMLESRIEPEATDITVESSIEPKVQTVPLQPRVPDVPRQAAYTCFPSALAVRQNYPEGRPSWTLRAPGHEGTRCWYPTKRTTARD
jgi:hypothetical protein